MKRPTKDPVEIIVALATIFCVSVICLWALTAVVRFVIWAI